MKFLVATVTPFDKRGRVDLAGLRAHILWLAAKGVDGFLPTLFTGELPYLSDREREAIHRTVLDSAFGKQVYPCTWDPSASTTMYLTDAAIEQGAAGVVLPPPLHYDLEPAQVRRWYEQLAHHGTKVFGWHDPHHRGGKLDAGLYKELRADGILGGMLDASEDAYRVRRQASLDPGAVFAAGDRVLGRVHDTKDLRGVVSALGNAWPGFCQRLARTGEANLEEALVARVAGVRAAGGARALKGLLNMSCRPPLGEPDPELLMQLPPPERP